MAISQPRVRSFCYNLHYSLNELLFHLSIVISSVIKDESSKASIVSRDKAIIIIVLSIQSPTQIHLLQSLLKLIQCS